MPKEEWGTKRLCPTTGKRFYDLNKDPIISPYTGEVVSLETGKATRVMVADKADSDAVHAFVIDAPEKTDFSTLKRDVIQAALRCHWASVVHAPKVELREGNTIEVSVYALDADHAPIVESAVRSFLAGAGAARKPLDFKL